MSHSISRYLNVRQAYCPDFVADGRSIVFLTDITGVPQVWQVATARDIDLLAWPDQRTFEADRVQGVWASPARGDGRVIYARDAGGNENAGLFLLEPGGAERCLTSDAPGAMHSFGEWSPDGTQMLFSANRRDAGFFDAYLQPIDRPARMIWQNDERGYIGSLCFAPDGVRAAAVRAASSTRSDLVEIDLATSTARQLSPVGEEAQYAVIGYTSDGRSLLVTTDLGSDFVHVARFDLVSLVFEPLVAPEWDIAATALSPDGQLLAYVVNEGGRSSLQVRDLETGQVRTAPLVANAPGVVAWLDGRLRFSADGTLLLFSFTSATRASDIYVWDRADERVTVLTRTSHAGLPVDEFVVPALIHYPTFDDRHIPAWFYQPRAGDEHPGPAIVIVHGGPEGQSTPAFNFLVQYFSQKGYAVLVPNVRGSTGYGKTYGHLDDARKRMDAVADLAYAAQWLKQQPGIDGNRLVVYGGSYGGFMVLATLTTNPELWAASVDIVGISNLATFLENTSAYRRAHREAEYGSLEHDREYLESIAPINHADRVVAPLMVIHGANDPRVPLSEAEQLVGALQGRGIPVQFLVFDDEGHGIVKLKNKLVAYPAIVAFLEAHLPR